jgi:hypothetical protein
VRIRYFLVEDSGEVRKIAQAALEGAWEDNRTIDTMPGTRSVGIITVLCDESFQPLQCFQTRVRVSDGRITEESRDDARHAWFLLRPPLDIPDSPSPPREDPRSHPAVVFQVSGWPPEDELRRQLAVALDVPVDQVPAFFIGGPLIAALQLDVAIRQALTYFPAQPPENE